MELVSVKNLQPAICNSSFEVFKRLLHIRKLDTSRPTETLSSILERSSLMLEDLEGAVDDAGCEVWVSRSDDFLFVIKPAPSANKGLPTIVGVYLLSRVTKKRELFRETRASWEIDLTKVKFFQNALERYARAAGLSLTEAEIAALRLLAHAKEKGAISEEEKRRRHAKHNSNSRFFAAEGYRFIVDLTKEKPKILVITIERQS